MRFSGRCNAPPENDGRGIEILVQEPLADILSLKHYDFAAWLKRVRVPCHAPLFSLVREDMT
jgi:hypothetical protein